LKEFGVAGFTSGCVCVAPSKSMDVLRALQADDIATTDKLRERFAPLEDLRNAHGPIPVLHHAVALAGIADTGPHLPLMSALGEGVLAEIEPVARELLAFEGGAD
jgi:dihydrodipicolinate synthase/N-acetylneuraminate lyase